jgi:lipopolysaccharide transport system ATP-binding protein
MSDIAISVHNLSKKYTIGAIHNQFPTFRDLITKKIKSIFRSDSYAHHNEETIWVLREISFDVKEGEVIGVIGQNGAGKSTLLKILSRITLPTMGRVKIFGRVSSLLEVGTGFHPELTGRDNVYLNGAILGMSRKEVSRKFDEIVSFAEVEKFIDTPIKHYSSGMYVRLAFAVAAHIDPEILIVDEVLSVGDVRFQKKCLGKIGSVAREGRTVLFVSHNLDSIERLCTRGIMLSQGRIYASGEISHVVNKYVEMNKDSGNSRKKLFPAHNTKYNITLEMVTTRLDAYIHNGHNSHTLTVTYYLHFGKPCENIGLGIIIFTNRAVCVSKLGAGITGFVLDKVNKGKLTCSIIIDNIDQHIAGGDYDLDIKIGIPNVEQIIKIGSAASFRIPPKDVYQTGRFFVQSTHGIVPLKANFRIEE